LTPTVFVSTFAIVRIPDLEIFELQAKLCSTMGNANRLRIIEVLKAGEASVGAIAEALGCTVSTASQHLRIMRDANLVSARKDGQTVYYRLRSPKVVECCQMVRNLLIEDLQQQGRIARDYAALGPTAWPSA
jgi:ArsR family transcriptional regulator, virulence genes transcriptional regulator